ncbi:Clr5 domain-containing protein [Diplogelasinospora grovesii]|uniref:Clr5 domain-containing protein n=1 Tax=Diplogelasinospora grovesii TaxID=303347 RepID=A0AAN6N921_9PEZI|nr:Clr5 domain-containing protein [Diplogelasinospora grovesii]
MDSKKWAKGPDWIVAKPIINRLYKDEQRTLKEVMAIMEMEHNFHATPKMYKTRLKEWGISKTVKSTEVVAALQTLENYQAVGKSSQVTIHGKEIDLEFVRNYIKRNKSRIKRLDVGEAAISLALGTNNKPPRPRVGLGYDRPAEELLSTMAVYVDGAFSGKQWFVDVDGSCRSRKGGRGNFFLLDLWDRLDIASKLMAESAEVDLVRMLDPAFGYLDDIIREEDPRSVPFLMSCFEVLRYRGRVDLMGLFLRYTAQLSARMLGGKHPQSRIWKQCLEMYDEEHQQLLGRLYMLLLDSYQKQDQRSAELEIGAYNDYCEAVLEQLDYETQEGTIRQQLRRIENEHLGKQSVELAFLRHRHCTALKNLRLQQGRHKEAEEAMDGLRKYGREYGDWDGALALQNRGDVRLEVGDLQGAEWFYRAASLLVNNNSLFRDEGWANSVFEGLEKTLLGQGKVGEAAEVRNARQERIAKLEAKKIGAEVAQKLAESQRNWMTETQQRRPQGLNEEKR